MVLRGIRLPVSVDRRAREAADAASWRSYRAQLEDVAHHAAS
jgi:hypothetical protein